MKKLLFFTLSVLIVIMSNHAFSQTWDKKTRDQRKTQILYKVCNGQSINQADFADLFEKGLLETMLNNIKSDKDVTQITKIIDSSREYFNKKCEIYYAKADSTYNSYILNIKTDSVATPEK